MTVATTSTTDPEPDADLVRLTDNELLALVAGTGPAVARLEQEASRMRTRQARAMRILQHHRQVKRALIAERAGVTESAVRQAIKNLERREQQGQNE